jgi:mersacidin/lichenicidin family type 2 lantibiotic
MSNIEIVRAWKDPEYRAMLNRVPPLPIGSIELEDPYLSENAIVRKGFASRRGEHTTVTGCNGGCGLTHSCSSTCHTVSHCPHTGWQCGALELGLGIDVE